MPNANYLAGRRFEYKVKKGLVELGYTVMRTAQSRGPFDIIAIRNRAPHDVQMIQCKVVKKITTANRMIKLFAQYPPFDPYGCKFKQCLEIWAKDARKRCWAFV